MSIKRRTFEILGAKAFVVCLMALIFLNVIAVVLQTVQSLASQYAAFFRVFAVVSVLAFTAEYALRVWTCTLDERFRRPILGRVRFVLTPLALVDLAAILPFYLPFLLPVDLRFLRSVRLLWMFRLFKMDRYTESFGMLGNVFRKRKEELLVTLFVGLVLLVISSSLMYFVENAAQPEEFSSIPASMWWGVQTLTTVGGGDVYPVTPLGQLLGGLIATVGIGMFALPAGILGSGLVAEIQGKDPEKTCPHCGKRIDESPGDRGR